jgi:histone deacetylase 1/2
MCAEIPVNEYYEYFGPDYELDVKSSNTEDLNSRAYLDRVKRIVLENLRHAGGPPSVQMSGMNEVVISAMISLLICIQTYLHCLSTKSSTIQE